MTPTTLHIFAVNGESALRHTNLTRAQGLQPELPPLEEWLGLDALLTDQIEIFPVEDLGDMSLSDYVVLAFDPVPPPDTDTRARLDALRGSVLLVPDTAMPADPKPGARLSAIASLPLAKARHDADLPKADVRGPAPPPEAPAPDRPDTGRSGVSWLALAVIAIAALLAISLLLGLV